MRNGGKSMDQNLKARDRLKSQIKEAYGRIVYTQTTHAKIVEQKQKKDASIKMIQIILSALTTGGCITAIIIDAKVANMVSVIISSLLLIYNSYTKNFNLLEESQNHNNVANSLWKIREEYISLLTDFDYLEIEDIRFKRDELQNKTFEIYKCSPQTNKKGYLEAQKCIKKNEEQSFNNKEINDILPEELRD